ncbi:hypothetical protein [Pseudomonas trivialis]|uniref:Uncharacterized protein n=1 Tax=Pseudomonas trivialis TaxID=200450 RepID=A0A0R2ZFM9_9PSED|nr:hypothetical protein [Pseudomonas trivialis]KRP59037.1 hypothetical protein TU79_16510 [Pseudomonas trivialis]SDS68644.1 hypothetical protein SAMN04490205_3295 [Pseudomonas trivialis]
MSEVKSFWCHEASNILCVRASDFDLVTARLDEARETLERWHELNLQREEKVFALQQRLTAADEDLDRAGGAYLNKNAECLKLRERADVLETALRKIKSRLDAYAEADMRMPEPSVEVCQMIADAALKPAEPATEEHICTGCGSKGWTANCAKCVPF